MDGFLRPKVYLTHTEDSEMVGLLHGVDELAVELVGA